jgi:hypothetical protein
LLNVVYPPSSVLERCIVRFPDFSATTLNASRSSSLSSPGSGTRPVALIREARNFVSKWPVRSLPLLQLNTGTMKFTSYEAQAIEPLVSNESLPGLDLSDTERAGFSRILSVFSRLQSES